MLYKGNKKKKQYVKKERTKCQIEEKNDTLNCLVSITKWKNTSKKRNWICSAKEKDVNQRFWFADRKPRHKKRSLALLEHRQKQHGKSFYPKDLHYLRLVFCIIVLGAGSLTSDLNNDLVHQIECSELLTVFESIRILRRKSTTAEIQNRLKDFWVSSAAAEEISFDIASCLTLSWIN